MKMKGIAVVLSLAMIVSVVTGCGKEQKKISSQEIVTEASTQENSSEDSSEDDSLLSDNADWVDAYINFLEDNKDDLMDWAFMSYVCDSEIPFLFVAKGGEWMNGMYIYIYNNGNLKQVGDSEYGHYGVVNIYEGLGLICVGDIRQGYNSEYFYNVSPSGEITESDSLYIENYDSPDNNQIYHYNDEVVDYDTWMNKKMEITKGRSGSVSIPYKIDDLIAYLKGEDSDRTVEYGDTIETLCEVRVVGAMSNMYGVDYYSQDVERETFVVSKESAQFIDGEFEIPSDEEIMEYVNEAIGKKKGETFTLMFSGGDGTYYHVYTIIDIQNDATSNEEQTYEDTQGGHSINTSTLCDRELRDFFQLHLGCYVDYALGNEKTEPVNISGMLKHTGVVGAITLDNGMRVVSDYNDSLFSMQLQGTDLIMKVKYEESVNYSCSVEILEANINGDFRYKEGTDAQIGIVAKITYYIDGEKVQISNPYVSVILENSSSSPSEWLMYSVVFLSQNDYSKVEGNCFTGYLEDEY
ncbi:MAG: hypothetical protein J6P57_08640 [Lachnospiraceae bacterium]|nr:hypothetical protein [Lachnospiraceae bacterium]